MMNINVCRIKTTNEAFNDKVHVRTLDTGGIKMKMVYVEGEIPQEHHPIIVLHGGLLSLHTSLQGDEVAAHHVEEVGRLLSENHSGLFCPASCVVHLDGEDGACSFLKSAAARTLPKVDHVRTPPFPDSVLYNIGVALIESGSSKWMRVTQCHWDESAQET